MELKDGDDTVVHRLSDFSTFFLNIYFRRITALEGGFIGNRSVVLRRRNVIRRVCDA